MSPSPIATGPVAAIRTTPWRRNTSLFGGYTSRGGSVIMQVTCERTNKLMKQKNE